MKYLLVLAVLLSACSKSEPAVVADPSPYNPSKTRMEHMCREDHEANLKLTEQLSVNGWEYRGPLYNDGINCSVTLWECGDHPASPCRK